MLPVSPRCLIRFVCPQKFIMNYTVMALWSFGFQWQARNNFLSKDFILADGMKEFIPVFAGWLCVLHELAQYHILIPDRYFVLRLFFLFPLILHDDPGAIAISFYHKKSG